MTNRFVWAVAIALLLEPGAAHATSDTGAVLTYRAGDSQTQLLAVQADAARFGASETYRTSNAEIREVVLPSGASITLGPDSEVTVQSSNGLPTLKVVRGAVRIVGSTKDTLDVVLPGGNLAVANSVMMVKVDPNGDALVQLVFGSPVVVTGAGGRTELARPGFASALSASGDSGEARRLSAEEVSALDALVSTRGLRDGSASLASNSEGGGGEARQSDETVYLATEEKPDGNVPAEPEPPVEPEPPPPPVVPAARPEPAAGGDLFASLGPGAGADAPLLSNNQPSQANGDARGTTQTYANASINATNDDVIEPTRAPGRTTNRLYSSSEPFTQVLGGTVVPSSVSDPVIPVPGAEDFALRYVFSSDGLVLQSEDAYNPETHVLFDTIQGFHTTFDVGAPVIFLTNQAFNTPGEVLTVDTATDVGDSLQGRGSFFAPATHFDLLQTGFTFTARSPDNFLLLQVRPGVITSRANDVIAANFEQSGDRFAFTNSIGIGISGNFASTLITQPFAQTIGSIVTPGLEDAGLTNASIRGPMEAGYAAYVASVQPILDAIDAAVTAGSLNDDLAVDVRRSLVGQVFTVGFTNPTVDINAVLALAQDPSGTPTDLIAFLTNLGDNMTTSIDFTSAQIDALAAALVQNGPTSEVTEDQLLPFAFLSAFERTSLLDRVNVITDTTLDTTRDDQFVFATGNLDARLDPSFVTAFSVDRFFLSAGLNGFEQRSTQTIADGIRAFFRTETAIGLDLFDTGVFTINPATEGGEAVNAFLHADFAMSGTGPTQESTLSLTLGEVSYTTATCTTCDVTESVEVLVAGRSIGTTRGDIVTTDVNGVVSPAVRGTLAFSSPLRSTSAGGGNPALPRPGYAGYLVLENFDPANQAINPGDTELTGGIEHVVGDADNGLDVTYGYLRLATATGTETAGSRTDVSLDGFAAALAERTTTDGTLVTQADTGNTSAGLHIELAAATNRAQVDLQLFGANTIQLGGLTGAQSRGASAFLDDTRFAARSSAAGSELGFLSSGLVGAGLPPDIQNALPDNDFIKWGFFFGDFETTAGDTEHVHLGTWVAGDNADPGSLPETGTATYSGGVVGEAFNGTALYTATGVFTNAWDFATRRGTASLGFDGTTYTGTTEIQAGTSAFVGDLAAENRQGGLFGQFVSGGTDPIAGEIGRFSISNTAAAPDSYRASGTFAAERQPGGG